MVYLKKIGLKLLILFCVSCADAQIFSSFTGDGISSTIGNILRGFSVGVKEVTNGLRSIEEILDIVDTAVEEECIFSCPRGQQAIRNSYFSTYPNGCGSYGFQLKDKSLSLKDMELCCNDHDVCYGTCLADKDLCDLKFKKCLYNTCDRHKKFLQEGGLKGCKGAAKLFYLATVGLGCKAYLDSQKKACICIYRNEL
ncbi:group XIIA secretory phospholipase A2-like [Limulus polyphemus]|uniref:Group XIIA secretory phospholipase A2-like n=1 Tax=Limulus polyphemus TaxID=6850 RepID=A0ABM1C5H4_LIMPO|nr:group XIIA secretory phospholipase A2-like [Limulus polyphemus]